MTKPIAVVISDIHFSLNTLELASKALRAALTKAEELQIPLVIAGDLNDTKAIIRAEVANELIDILKGHKTSVFIMEGNHDKINEKGVGHGLNYLAPYATIIDQPTEVDWGLDGIYVMIPYYTDIDALKQILRTVNKGSILIMHQGVKGAWMGDYVQDKSSIDTKELSKFKVISGHYHRHQTVGTVTYIGSPYTITFGEANDGPKGFLIMNSDGSFERVILNLRKHMIIDTDKFLKDSNVNIRPEDLVWVKIKGSKDITGITKKQVADSLIGHMNFKLEKIYTEEVALTKVTGETDQSKLDNLIDEVIDEDKRDSMKQLWRSLV